MEVKQEYNVKELENDYTKVAASPEFQNLLKEKRRFIAPLSIFFLLFFIMLPILTSYSKILNTAAIGAITWAWVFAFAQFIMTWILCSVYSKKAESFDRSAQKIVDLLSDKGDTQ